MTKDECGTVQLPAQETLTQQTAPQPPVAKKVPHIRSFHGIDFTDNYEWMRDKDSEELRTYLEAENAYTQARTTHLDELTETLFQEVKARVKETDMSVPTRANGYWFFGRTEEGKSYSQLCRIPVTDADNWIPPVVEPGIPADGEEVYLDANELAEGHDFFSLGAASVSPDGTLLAYSTDTAGDERYTLRFRNLSTGEELPDVVADIASGVTWVGNETVYYTKVDPSWRPHEVWRHRLGTSVTQDECIYREDDEHFWVGVGQTRSRRFLMVYSGSKVTSEQWYLDLEDPNAQLTCLLPREAGVEYSASHAIVDGEDRWLICHNKNGANCELGWATIATTGSEETARESHLRSLDELSVLVEHRDDVRLEGVDVFSDHILLEARANALTSAWMMKLVPGQGLGEFEPLASQGELETWAAGGSSDWDTPIVRIGVASFTRPMRLYELDLRTDERVLRKEGEVLPLPDGTPFDPADYTSSRLWVEARDGEKIPVSLIHRAEIDPTKQTNPMLLYGYGSYEASMDPSFSLFRLSMMDRGVVYAVAHVRGGGEMGRRWYDMGKTTSKRNTFTDFIDVADHLIESGLTSPDKLVAEGGSAGGLLMGAVANMAGDRFAGIQAIVPFVDPLTSMLMPELPLTVTEWDEWGNPYEDPEIYRYMASYAPYENISAEAVYPPILAVTSLNDTRVLYVEPAKWVAKLRDVAGADVLLKTDMTSGHGGVSGRYESWRQSAFETAWELDRLGATRRL